MHLTGQHENEGGLGALAGRLVAGRNDGVRGSADLGICRGLERECFSTPVVTDKPGDAFE